MDRQALPGEMRRRLREYFHQTAHLRSSSKQKELMDQMSPSLQSEVAWQCNQQWLTRVWFLKDAPLMFLVELALGMRAKVFAPGELAPAGWLYIIHRGLAVYGGKVLGMGKGACFLAKAARAACSRRLLAPALSLIGGSRVRARAPLAVWGEDVILTSEELRRKYCARAMNFLEVFCVNRATLEDVARGHPEYAKRLRKLAVRLAVRRAFIHVAQARNPDANWHTGSNIFDKLLRKMTAVPDTQAGGSTRMSRWAAGMAPALAQSSAAPQQVEIAEGAPDPSAEDFRTRAAQSSYLHGQERESFRGGGEATPFGCAPEAPSSPQVAGGASMDELRAELEKQADAQRENRDAIAALTEAVNALRRDLLKQ